MAIHYQDQLLSASGASSTQNFAIQMNYYENLRIYVDVTVAAGLTLDYKLQSKDVVSGNYVDVPNAAFTQIIATGTYALQVGPSVNVNVSGKNANALLDANLRLVETLGGGSATRSINIVRISD